MDEAKIDQLRILHRELSKYLVQQSEVIIDLRKAVGGIQQTLRNASSPQGERSALENRYREHLASQSPIVTPRPNLAEVLSRDAVESLAKKLEEW